MILTIFYRYLNKFIKGHVVEPKLGKALLTVYFHRWNTKRQSHTHQEIKSPNVIDKLDSEKEEFGLGALRSQSIAGVLDGKWTNKKSIAFGHDLVPRIYTYRLLKNKLDKPHLLELCGLSQDTQVPHSSSLRIDNCSKFGFKAVPLTDAVDCDLIFVMSNEIAKFVKNCDDRVKHSLLLKGLDGDVENNK